MLEALERLQRELAVARRDGTSLLKIIHGYGSTGAGGDIRIAVGSVAPVPLRLLETERLLTGKPVDPSLLVLAKKSVLAEIRPIDDIRSSARYRAAVAGNLVAEFLEKLGERGQT